MADVAKVLSYKMVGFASKKDGSSGMIIRHFYLYECSALEFKNLKYSWSIFIPIPRLYRI